MDYSPPGSSVHGESPGRNTGVGCQFLLQYRPMASTLILHYYHLGTSSARGTLIMKKKKKKVSTSNPLASWCFGLLNNLATWCEELTYWKRPWCWERLKTGEGDDRGWDSWMAHWLDGDEFEQALGVDDGQGSPTCWSPWACKELDTTLQLDWLSNPYTKIDADSIILKMLTPIYSVNFEFYFISILVDV